MPTKLPDPLTILDKLREVARDLDALIQAHPPPDRLADYERIADRTRISIAELEAHSRSAS